MMVVFIYRSRFRVVNPARRVRFPYTTLRRSVMTARPALGWEERGSIPVAGTRREHRRCTVATCAKRSSRFPGPAFRLGRNVNRITYLALPSYVRVIRNSVSLLQSEDASRSREYRSKCRNAKSYVQFVIGLSTIPP
jgi:hypothetical protein